MSRTQPMPTILIVGAGPTGLTLANELLRRGIKPRLIEKTTDASPNSKALGVMARTLELLTPSGIAREMLEQGVKVPTLSVWSSGRHLARFDFANGIESPYPFILMIPQHTTEAILTNQLTKLGGMVERGVELISLVQREDHVEASLRYADGTLEQNKSNFLVGCDGAHSAVRHLLGLPFVGTTVEQSFATGNVRMHWNVPHDQALAYLNRGRLITYFPLPDGHHRFIIVYPPEETPQGEITLEEIQRAIDSCGPVGARADEPAWLARYHVHQRKVDRYVQQHVILAGDAAHIHSPLGAQGMNTGIQDAMNLAWKLALIVQGHAPAHLLESYQIERSEVGTRLLQDDELLTRQALMHHPLGTATRDCVAPHITQLSQTQQVITSTAAELRISYQHGPLVSDYRGEKVKLVHSEVKIGDRAPNELLFQGKQTAPCHLYDLLTGTNHALLIFLQQRGDTQKRELLAMLTDWQDMLDIYPIRRLSPGEKNEQTWYDPGGTLARLYGIANEGLILIRPDGYISLRSRPIAGEPLQDYLHAHFSLQHA